MLAKTALLRYNNYSDKKRVIICVLKGILDVYFSVKSAHSKQIRIYPCFLTVLSGLFIFYYFSMFSINSCKV